MKGKILSQAISLLVRGAQRFSLPRWICFGSALGTLCYWIDWTHRRRAHRHLARALGLKKEKVKRRARASYQNMGRSLFETIYFAHRPASEIQQWVQVDGLCHYMEARNQKKGVILLTAHLGNWELIPKVFLSYGFRTAAVMRPLNDPILDRMVQKWRAQNGLTGLRKGTSVLHLLNLLRAGETIGFLLDQNAGAGQAVFVDFFGCEAATHRGPAVLALRCGAPVVPVFMIREGTGHRMIIEKAVDLVKTGLHRDDVVKNTARFTQIIESYVAGYPEQWFWVHRRWKTKRKGS